MSCPSCSAIVATIASSRCCVQVRAGRPCEHLQGAVSHLAAQRPGSRSLLRRLAFVAGEINGSDFNIDGSERRRLWNEVNVIVHAAATTKFTAPADSLHGANVEGTRHALEFARRCRRLQQFLFVSTVCVAGTNRGIIAEQLEEETPEFVNAYEQTKYQAEQLVAGASLPARIARLSICLGGHETGYVHRFGAIHQTLRWLIRGLVPMIPAVESSCLDLIATDIPARWIARAVALPANGTQVYQVAAGGNAASLPDLIATAVAQLRHHGGRWRNGEIEQPLIVDAATFSLFERSVAQSRDVIFSRVLSAARSFFPMLLYPKVYQTDRAEELWGGPLPLSDWRSTVRNVIDFGCAHEWRHSPAMEPEHV
jgi:nucleoside-diphosphate-sugar epimerase